MTARGSNTFHEPEEWTAVGFLDEFMRFHKTMEDRSFAFLLGAGASVSSGIPSGATLARRWVEEVYRIRKGENPDTSLEEWATPENLGIEGFSLEEVAACYPQVYEKRFGKDADSGYAYLEDLMGAADPNIGYSILAQVLEKTRHKVVITTNFDNLVADALSIYTRTFPLVCGHESLTGFARPRLRRPLVAKIHRDLLLAPKSGVAATSKLDKRWAGVLRRLLGVCPLIVVGYGGNDGSLMDFLEKLKQGAISGGLYWCYRMTDGRPNERIRRLVARHNGKLVPIVGFDEFMLQLGERLEYKPLAEEIEARAKKLVKRYREQLEKFQKNLTRPQEDPQAEEAAKLVREALDATVERESSWWAWDLKARKETEPEKQEKIYRQGLEQFPESPELTGNFALFLHEVRKRNDEAEHLYRRALELDPDNATITGNFANFTWEVHKDHDEAERLYHHVLELDPDHANIMGNFATFLHRVRKDYDEAERLYQHALELDPANARHTGNFALFLQKVRKDYDEAERLYRRALELDPDNMAHAGNFALFLQEVRKDYDEAERLYRQGLESHPNDATITANFATFIAGAHRDYDEAERLYRRSLELDPDNATATGGFAVFLQDMRKDYDEAERLYRRTLELDPDNANTAGNFAEFLIVQNEFDDAKRMLSRAWTLNAAEDAFLVGQLALYWCLIARLGGRHDTPGLARLKFVLEVGFLRRFGSFDTVLAAVRERLSAEEFALYTALAAAIDDEEKVAGLEQFERWKQIEPIPIDEPWDMDD